jgi:hypothetical protein
MYRREALDAWIREQEQANSRSNTALSPPSRSAASVQPRAQRLTRHALWIGRHVFISSDKETLLSGYMEDRWIKKKDPVTEERKNCSLR